MSLLHSRSIRLALWAFMTLSSQPVLGQEAIRGEIRGTVADSQGAVLPGVTVTALHPGTGETRVATTSDSGLYRLPALALGNHTVTVELAGFTTVKREGIDVGLGQRLTLDFVLEVGNLEETVTVVGGAPLIDTTTPEVSGLLQPEQIVSLPLMGRNWMELGLLMPGVSSTTVHPRGVGSGTGDVVSQNVIIDGIDSREECCFRSAGTHSQESIAEFKIISNNFPAEYGRSSSYVMTAVTKSGTNAFHGSGFYLFRDEKLDRPDFFTGTTEPLKYYQTGGSFGGPIKTDRAFFFGVFERQFDERTGFSNTGFPELDSFKVPLRGWQHYGLAKGDVRLTDSQALSAKYYYWHQNDLNGSVVAVTEGRVGGENTPWGTTDRLMTNHGVAINHTWTRPSKVNQFTFGYLWVDWDWRGKSGVPTPTGFRNPEIEIPRIVTPSFNMGYNTATPQDPAYEYKFEFKDTASFYFSKWGEHDFKFGGSAILGRFDIGWFRLSRGLLNFVGDPVNPFDFNSYPEPTRFQISAARPTAACPDEPPADALAEFDRMGSCGMFSPIPFQVYGAFVQDSWSVNSRLTLNLGLRYDFENGPLLLDYFERANPQLAPQIPHPTRNDSNNVAPRVGFSYSLKDGGETVIRGGAGLYFGTTILNIPLNKLVFDGWNTIVIDQPFPTRQPCFQGHTLAEAIENPSLLYPGCGALNFDQLYAGSTKAISALESDFQVDRSIQTTIGVAHQLTQDLALEADIVYNRTGPGRSASDTNLFLDPDTGGPRDPARFGRPDPRFSSILTHSSWGKAEYKALSLRVNKRMSGHYQFQANYTLASAYTNVTGVGISPQPDNPLDRNEWGPADGSQRHRLTVNGIIDGLPLGLELSTVFMAWSGIHYDDRVAGDFWNLGRASSRAFRDANGQIVRLEKFSNIGDPYAKLDFRVSRWFRLGSDRRLGLIAEFFNVLNKKNFGSYGTIRGSRTYQQPLRQPGNQYSPFQTQLGVRYIF